MAGERLLRQGEQRRKEMVKFISDYWRKNSRGPSIADIAEAVGLESANATRHHLMRLRDEGIIVMDTKVGRSIQVKDDILTLEDVTNKKWPKTTRFIAVQGRQARKPAKELAGV